MVFLELGIDVGYIHEEQTVVSELLAVDTENALRPDQRCGRADACGIVSDGQGGELIFVFLGYVNERCTTSSIDEEYTGLSVHLKGHGNMAGPSLEKRNGIVTFCLHDAVIGSGGRSGFGFYASVGAPHQEDCHEEK